ncbi:MAG: DUF2791 family P-loop domain-containing protein [Chloroflexota bacterium]|nr:DUF2791 family P-loop domain-containing protein [Chloroflexota bacterium]MDE2959852.1 DUF2791 family P-loop domain-containing protein [Chloroflexota bacterium]
MLQPDRRRLLQNPRNTVKEFVNMLSVLDQNPGVQWQSLIGSVNHEEDAGAGDDGIAEDGADDELTSFKL